MLQALRRWGSREPLPATDLDMTVGTFAVALSTVFSPPGPEVDVVVALRIGDDRLVAHVHDGALDLSRGTPVAPDATVESDVSALRGVLWHGRPLSEAEADGEVRVSGSRAVVRRFLRLFPAPVPGPTPA